MCCRIEKQGSSLDGISLMFKQFLFVIGISLFLLGILLPVELIVSRAIPPEVLKCMEEAGKQARIIELRQQFTQGLGFCRVALVVLGAWSLFIGLFFKRLIVPDGGIKRDAGENGCLLQELWVPAGCFVLVVILSLPLLSKGFEHAEFLGYSMLAERGPLVTMACQNLPPRAGQVGFTLIESIFVKILGGSETVARLPAVLIGAAAMFPLYFVARNLGSMWFAGMACAGLGVTGFFLFYATYARGYSLAMTGYLFCVLMALRLQKKDTWTNWMLLGSFMILTCYAHLASCFYVAVIGMVVIGQRIYAVKITGGNMVDILGALAKPVVMFVSSVFVLFLLYSPAIPAELKYMRTFDLTNYYMSYHLDQRFIKVMVELWAWVRDCFPVAVFQAVLCAAGLAFVFMKKRWLVAYMVSPLLVSVVLIWLKGLFVYPRFFVHFLPFYVMLGVFAVFELCNRLGINERVASVILAACLLVTAPFTLSRLYGMERCGARSAVEKVRSMMLEDDRVMAVLDGYITIRHYFPGVISGYRDCDFWREMRSLNNLAPASYQCKLN